ATFPGLHVEAIAPMLESLLADDLGAPTATALDLASAFQRAVHPDQPFEAGSAPAAPVAAGGMAAADDAGQVPAWDPPPPRRDTRPPEVSMPPRDPDPDPDLRPAISRPITDDAEWDAEEADLPMLGRTVPPS